MADERFTADTPLAALLRESIRQKLGITAGNSMSTLAYFAAHAPSTPHLWRSLGGYDTAANRQGQLDAEVAWRVAYAVAMVAALKE